MLRASFYAWHKILKLEVEQIFNRLKRTGVVVAERGPRGGYRLARSQSDIRASDIFRSLAPKKVAAGTLSASDPTLHLWRQVEEAVHTTLEATSLETLVAQAREKAPSPVNHRFTFHI